MKKETFRVFAGFCLALVLILSLVWLICGVLDWITDTSVYQDNPERWVRAYGYAPTLQKTFEKKIMFFKELKIR